MFIDIKDIYFLKREQNMNKTIYTAAVDLRYGGATWWSFEELHLRNNSKHNHHKRRCSTLNLDTYTHHHTCVRVSTHHMHMLMHSHKCEYNAKAPVPVFICAHTVYSITH